MNLFKICDELLAIPISSMQGRVLFLIKAHVCKFQVLHYPHRKFSLKIINVFCFCSKPSSSLFFHEAYAKLPQNFSCCLDLYN